MQDRIKISSVIVDDEPLAQKGILHRLGEFPEIEIRAVCSSGIEAVETINRCKPNLLFLDIQMPEMNGFKVLRHLKPESLPYVIFITAYDKYAIKAFEVNAVDYLLKPIDNDRFREAVSKAIERLKRDMIIEFSTKLNSLLEITSKSIVRDESSPEHEENNKSGTIAVKSSNKIIVLDCEDIYQIEAYGDYIHLFTKDQKIFVRDTLKGISKRLDETIFVRIHRSHIVNLHKIKEMNPCDRGDYNILLHNGIKIRASRNYTDNLEELLKINL
jgi:two-component system, LytTR family, response regulator